MIDAGGPLSHGADRRRRPAPRDQQLRAAAGDVRALRRGRRLATAAARVGDAARQRGHQPGDHRLHRCRTAAGHELVPLVWANACPSGPVTEDAFERLAAMLLDGPGRRRPARCAVSRPARRHGHRAPARRRGRAAPPDARRSRPTCRSWRRSTCTPTSPRRWSTHSDALVAYRTYPHIDLAVTGARCLPLLERLMARRAARQGVARGSTSSMPLPWQCTHDRARPGALCACCDELEAAGALSASICMGFPPADTPVCGPSVLAYAAERGDRRGRGEPAGRRPSPQPSRISPAGSGRPPRRSVATRGRPATGPSILADTQDNPGRRRQRATPPACSPR